MLNISIVLFQPRWQLEIIPLLAELRCVQSIHRIYLVDNSPQRTDSVPMSDERVVYIYTGKNLGFGAGHNIAIRESIYDSIPLHLVMNSDVRVKAEDIDLMCRFVAANKEVGSLMPRVTYPDGRVQHLCKLLPTPMDVFGRRFLPKRWMQKRNDRYELVDSEYDRMLNVPYLSGCFMLLRTEAVQKARLFDERFFMYPEDMDLTRRIHRDYLTLYWPDVTIIHDHAQASYHNLHMLWIHVVNMCRYFNKWGWFHDPERKLMNRLTLEQLTPTK